MHVSLSTDVIILASQGATVACLAKAAHVSYLMIIDFWPDNQAVSPSLFGGRTFRPSPNID
jgi:hypothetical protein